MEQLEMLWEYQEADMAVNKMEMAIKRSPTRQKLVKCRDYLLEQQNVGKSIESEVSNMTDRIEALKDAVAMTADQLSNLQSKIETSPAGGLDDVEAYLGSVKRLSNNIATYEQELKRIRKDSAEREKQHHDVKVRYAKYKAEFDKLKLAYDEEYKASSIEIDALRSTAQKKAQGIDAELMERYNTIKMHSMPPLARLNGNQCGGCNMSLPSAVARDIKAGKLVECETCGRLLLS